ncbi:hypothetical protein CAK95_00130 [Pseudorhodoplanes sinuspersici]|uniref:Uncharacterized protein n=1 Tax=Pseudorhodoplanes sinuspersici TaxID=1235591 RepID=A0A1W6ZK79_9HYPH|nr:hypothetical protein CAK95_00130 [Pseudorhodoplanes sinuspersici]
MSGTGLISHNEPCFALKSSELVYLSFIQEFGSGRVFYRASSKEHGEKIWQHIRVGLSVWRAVVSGAILALSLCGLLPKFVCLA